MNYIKPILRLFISAYVVCLSADSSTDPCNELYMGPSAHSEVEVKSIVDFLLARSYSHDERILAYVTYHSYDQRILTRGDLPANNSPDVNDELVSNRGQSRIYCWANRAMAPPVGR